MTTVVGVARHLKAVPLRGGPTSSSCAEREAGTAAQEPRGHCLWPLRGRGLCDSSSFSAPVDFVCGWVEGSGNKDSHSRLSMCSGVQSLRVNPTSRKGGGLTFGRCTFIGSCCDGMGRALLVNSNTVGLSGFGLQGRGGESRKGGDNGTHTYTYMCLVVYVFVY